MIKIISEILGFIGVGLNAIVYQQKKRDRLLVFKWISDWVWMFHYGLMYNFSGAAVAAIGIARESTFLVTDRKGIEFPIRCRMGYSELLNSVPLWLGDKRLDNIDFQILYFTNESKERVGEVIAAYKNRREPDEKHTRGLYFRGVI